ncbi:hypothetical protein [Fretibacter rubidus]|uniref:hypothetical protein n=1 Tax=Fretibacter rubidus TaxID=570162 RepID=UPI00352A8EA0
MANVITKTPWWFWVVSGLAFVWNLLGVGAFFADMSMSYDDMVTNYGTALADAAANQPGFITVAYGVAVLGGAIGCLLLLLRRKLALWPLLLSLICVLIQQGYSWFGTDVMSTVSAGNKAMYISIVIIAVFLVWFARAMTARTILR